MENKKEEHYYTYTCKDCVFHSAGFCLKRYSTTGNYETCDEWDSKDKYKYSK